MAKVAKDELLKKLSGINAVVLDITATMDMGLECTIVSGSGIKFSVPGMFIDTSNGHWPIEIKVTKNKASGDELSFLLHDVLVDENFYFSDASSLEIAFLELFGVDQAWDEFDAEQLQAWYHRIKAEGKSILDVTLAHSEFELSDADYNFVLKTLNRVDGSKVV